MHVFVFSFVLLPPLSPKCGRKYFSNRFEKIEFGDQVSGKAEKLSKNGAPGKGRLRFALLPSYYFPTDSLGAPVSGSGGRAAHEE